MAKQFILVLTLVGSALSFPAGDTAQYPTRPTVTTQTALIETSIKESVENGTMSSPETTSEKVAEKKQVKNIEY